jgi:hypothetical protein
MCINKATRSLRAGITTVRTVWALQRCFLAFLPVFQDSLHSVNIISCVCVAF